MRPNKILPFVIGLFDFQLCRTRCVLEYGVKKQRSKLLWRKKKKVVSNRKT